jgi:hypothetical protein
MTKYINPYLNTIINEDEAYDLILKIYDPKYERFDETFKKLKKNEDINFIK